MNWNIYFQAFTVRTWRKRLSNLNTFLTPHIYWGIHITICVNYNQHMEPETVDKLCSNMDILPTLSNMFGLEYDSRLFMGKDIFSSSEGFVLFKDKNWISEKGKRSELIGKDDEYVAEMDKKAAMMFNYSALILDKDYYACLDLEENTAQEKPAA